MTTITAQTILSSEHAQDPSLRLTTLLLRLPRWIHAENRTHRALRIGEDFVIEPLWPALMEDPSLSRNAGSSRAIPIQKMIQDVIRDTAVPLYWGKARKGMQATEETHALVKVGGGMIDVGEDIWVTPEQAWLLARDVMVHIAKAFDEAGYHKQVPNRLLEPFSHITVLVTATNWSNFLALRDHHAAEPHIRMLAHLPGLRLDELEEGQDRGAAGPRGRRRGLAPGRLFRPRRVHRCPHQDRVTEAPTAGAFFVCVKLIAIVSPVVLWETENVQAYQRG